MFRLKVGVVAVLAAAASLVGGAAFAMAPAAGPTGLEGGAELGYQLSNGGHFAFGVDAQYGLNTNLIKGTNTSIFAEELNFGENGVNQNELSIGVRQPVYASNGFSIAPEVGIGFSSASVAGFSNSSTDAFVAGRLSFTSPGSDLTFNGLIRPYFTSPSTLLLAVGVEKPLSPMITGQIDFNHISYGGGGGSENLIMAGIRFKPAM